VSGPLDFSGAGRTAEEIKVDLLTERVKRLELLVSALIGGVAELKACPDITVTAVRSGQAS